jgi:glycosyltransferase involved in cell wall biosynthesis
MALHKARAIAAISEYTKHDVCRTFGVAPERITVSPCATSEHFTASSHEGEDQRRVDMLGVPNGYILYLGSIRPHKNLIRLLQAYKRLLAENSNAPSLVITGSRDGFRSRIPEFDALVQDEQLSKKVIYTGFVPEEDKPMLYRGALFYTLPSYHEGFGLMILEAMACGTPVLTSTATSCPEVAGDAALLVDPFSVEALTDGLRRLVTDADYRQELIRRGFERVTHFSWELSAQRIYEVYQQALR